MIGHLNQKTAKHLAWEHGIVAGWYLRDDQLPAYYHLRNKRFPVYEAARRFGKTTIELVCDIEDSLTQSQRITRWCEPWKYQAREIVMPEMDKIVDTCPKRFKPKFYKTDSFYEFPHNGSKIYLRGVNEDKGESARGSFAHKIVADEKGSWKDVEYIVNEVLMPQLLTTKGGFASLSTPPRDLGHRWYEDKELAIREDRFFQNLIYDNKSLSNEEIALICQAIGGPDSPAWKREFLCQAVPDPTLQVIPEYSDELNVVPNDFPRPDHCDFYVGGDNGVDDNTALLFGYYDFKNDWLVIEDEIFLNNTTTELISKLAKKKELELWSGRTPYRRAYDANAQVLLDLVSTYRYTVFLPEKTDRIAAIRALRIRIKQGKVKIKERCQVLRHQLRVGMWRDERHLDFQRSEDEKLKHLDGIHAAVYLNRSIVTSRNPYPQDPNVSVYTHLITPKDGSQEDADQALVNAFS